MLDDLFRKYWIFGFLTIPFAVDAIVDWYFELANPFFHEDNYWWEDIIYHWFLGSGIFTFVGGVVSTPYLIWIVYVYLKQKNGR
jgi:hypothetical protein